MELSPKKYLYRRIVQAKLFIDENYQCRLNLGDSSDAAHFSKFHFIRLFRRIYGCTPHQYLLKVRLEKARELLSNGKGIAQVCSDTGFESLGSFSA